MDRPHLLINFDEMLFGSLYYHTLPAILVGGGGGGRVGGFVFFYALQAICCQFANFFFTENFGYLNFCDDVIHREIFLRVIWR